MKKFNKCFLLIQLLLATLLCSCNKEPEKKVSVSDLQPRRDIKKAALINIEMGDKYLSSSQVARAKSKYIHALKLQPKLPEAHSAIGYYYEYVGDPKESEVHHLKAISLSTKNISRYYNNYGTFLCRQKRYTDASSAFNKALEDKQYLHTAEIYENYGICMLEQKRKGIASNYFELSLRHNPKQSQAAISLAQIAFDRRDYVKTRRVLDDYRKYNKLTAKMLAMSVKANYAIGDKDKAASDMLLLKAKYPDSHEYKELVGNEQ